MDTCEREDYVHPDCPCLNSRIGFEVRRDEHDQPIRSQYNVAIGVSVPFVEEFFCY